MPPALRGILLCGVCKVPVEDEMDMKKHRTHLKCTDCDFVTISEDELDSHISGKHSILPDWLQNLQRFMFIVGSRFSIYSSTSGTQKINSISVHLHQSHQNIQNCGGDAVIQVHNSLKSNFFK